MVTMAVLQQTPLFSILASCLIIQQVSGFGTVPLSRSYHVNQWSSSASALLASPLDDFLGNIFGNADVSKDGKESADAQAKKDNDNGDELDEMSLSSFQQELSKRQEDESSATKAETTSIGEGEGDTEEEDEFTGYDLRDAIFYKYGVCYDVEFQPVNSYGHRTVYLNIMPFRLGKKPWRHATELDYLCHLQAVVEILVKYNQLDYVMTQLVETKKKPRPGTSPLIAVPLRLDLTPEQVDKILG